MALDEHSVQLSLSEHKYVELPLMRLIIVEAYRHILSMTRAHNVTASYAVRDASLHVVLRWR